MSQQRSPFCSVRRAVLFVINKLYCSSLSTWYVVPTLFLCCNAYTFRPCLHFPLRATQANTGIRTLEASGGPVMRSSLTLLASFARCVSMHRRGWSVIVSACSTNCAQSDALHRSSNVRPVFPGGIGICLCAFLYNFGFLRRGVSAVYIRFARIM